jgi:hypothetical protein
MCVRCKRRGKSVSDRVSHAVTNTRVHGGSNTATHACAGIVTDTCFIIAVVVAFDSCVDYNHITVHTEPGHDFDVK